MAACSRWTATPRRFRPRSRSWTTRRADGTAEHVRRRWPSVQVIDSGGNVGFAKANNIGIRATESDYVLLLNPDTVAPPGAIQTLVRGLASHPDAAIAGARLLGPTGFPELSWGAADHAVE